MTSPTPSNSCARRRRDAGSGPRRDDIQPIPDWPTRVRQTFKRLADRPDAHGVKTSKFPIALATAAFLLLLVSCAVQDCETVRSDFSGEVRRCTEATYYPRILGGLILVAGAIAITGILAVGRRLLRLVNGQAARDRRATTAEAAERRQRMAEWRAQRTCRLGHSIPVGTLACPRCRDGATVPTEPLAFEHDPDNDGSRPVAGRTSPFKRAWL